MPALPDGVWFKTKAKVLVMHKSNYQPKRSQQLYLQSLITKRGRNEVIVVHHVLEDTPTRLWLQIERRNKNDIVFERIIL